jgi:hypothetical protein
MLENLNGFPKALPQSLKRFSLWISFIIIFISVIKLFIKEATC